MVTRYMTFGLQFIVYLMLANKLGPYYMGIWGYFLLLTSYFSVLNLGLPSSITLSLVHSKNDTHKSQTFEKSAYIIIGGICALIALFAVINSFVNLDVLHKNELGFLFYVACFVGILSQYVVVFTSVARVKGHLLSMAFSLTITVVLMLLAVLFFSGEKLLCFLGGAFVLGNILSIIVYIYRRNVSFRGHAEGEAVRTLLSQGLFLFLYSLCFQFIFISTRTLVSGSYSVEQFGFFSFAYTAAHSVILFLEAVANLIFPKLVDKFSDKDSTVIKKTLKELRTGYISTTHLLMYVAMALFPLFIVLLPKYQESLPCINLMALTLLLYTNSYGYNTYLMSNHREKLIARNAGIVLLMNVTMGWLLIHLLHVPYYIVLFSTMCSYLVYSAFCVFYGCKMLDLEIPVKVMIAELFPIRLLIPFSVALIITIVNNAYLSFIPLFVFIIFNIPVLRDISHLVSVMIKNPKITDIKRD